MSQITSLSKTLTKKTITNLKTPQILKLGLWLTWGGCILTLLTTIGAINEQRNAIKTIGEDSTPSIVSAQRLKDGIAGMDAYAVNELLVPANQSKTFVSGYEERYKLITEKLVAAAHNITYGEKEQKPIETMQWWFGKYLGKIQQAQDFHERGDTNNALVSYREALRILDQKLFPAADDLDHVNFSALEKTYTGEKSFDRLSLLMIFISGFVLIGILLGLQLFISSRMRRTFNPLLILATGISIGFLAYAAGAFISASAHLKSAKEDAFDSMYVLREARYTAFSANAAQSRYLLDPSFAAKYEQDINNYIAKISQLPPGKTYENIVGELTANTAESRINKITGFTGFMADELNNITFPGEKEAALKMLSTFGKYVEINQKIRLLERSGKHSAAIALCIGQSPEESIGAFNLFRKANDATFNINDDAFKASINQGYRNMGGFEVKASIALGAIALLTLFGLTPRMKEYL